MVTDRAEIEGMMAIVVKGDALNKEQLQKAFDQIEEVDAVVSSIGGTPADPSADSQVPTCAAPWKSTQQLPVVLHLWQGSLRLQLLWACRCIVQQLMRHLSKLAEDLVYCHSL